MTNIDEIMRALPTGSWITARALADGLGAGLAGTQSKLVRLHRQGWADRRGSGTVTDPYEYSATDATTNVTHGLFQRRGRE